MSVIDVNDRGSNRLNGFFGELIGGIFQPQNNSQTDQLINEINYKNQELEAAKTSQKIAMAVAGILGVTAAVLGYKQIKK